MKNIPTINLDNKGLLHWLYLHSSGIVCVVKGGVRSLAEREKTNAGDKNMRAIKIDPVAKTITEIELAQNPNETLQELYNLIGCDLVELVQLDRGIIMAVDEEGKLKEIKGGFTFLGWGTVIAGTGIVLGGNSSKLKALQENLASFEMMTEWVDAADVPPPHAFVTAF